MSRGRLPGWVGSVNHVAPVTATLEFSEDSMDGTPKEFAGLEPARLLHCRWTQWGRSQGMAGGGAIGEDAAPIVGWLLTLP